MFKTLPQALDWLESIAPVNQIKPGLERISLIAKKLNLNKTNATVITVAGSNGKGTTCEMLSRILNSHNYIVGLFTSPAITHFNERIRVSGQNATDEYILESFKVIKDCSESNNTPLSYFEFATLSALYIFAKQNCRYIILEVGLGGRLDATNIMDNDCAIITSISLEHQTYLGNTIADIAKEKAGIIKNNKKVILSDKLPKECYEVAQSINAMSYQLGTDYSYSVLNKTFQITFEDSKNKKYNFSCDAIDFKASWQKTNFSLAIAAIQVLSIKIEESLVFNAMSDFKLEGRVQEFSLPTINKGNLVGWLDVAHNQESVKHLADFLRIQNPKRIEAVFSCLDDKNINLMLTEIKSLIAHWHILELNNERALNIHDIKQSLIRQGVTLNNITEHKADNFLSTVIKTYKENSQYIVFGSFMLISEIIAQLDRHVNYTK